MRKRVEERKQKKKQKVRILFVDIICEKGNLKIGTKRFVKSLAPKLKLLRRSLSVVALNPNQSSRESR